MSCHYPAEPGKTGRFSHGHLPEAGREIQTELNKDEGGGGGALAKNQPDASPRAVSQL